MKNNILKYMINDFINQSLKEDYIVENIKFSGIDQKKMNAFLSSSDSSKTMTTKNEIYKAAYSFITSYVSKYFIGTKNVKFNSAAKSSIVKTDGYYYVVVSGEGQERLDGVKIECAGFRFAKDTGDSIEPISEKEFKSSIFGKISFTHKDKKKEFGKTSYNDIFRYLDKDLAPQIKSVIIGFDPSTLMNDLYKHVKNSPALKEFTKIGSQDNRLIFIGNRKKISHSYVFAHEIRMIHFEKNGSDHFKIIYEPQFDSYGYNPTERLYSAYTEYYLANPKKDEIFNIVDKLIKILPELQKTAFAEAQKKASRTEKLL